MSMKRLGWFFAASVIILSIVCASHAAYEGHRGGEVVILWGGGTPRHFNPALISGSATAIVGTQIFASPLRYDDKWKPHPYLAESWAISDDGLSVTLKLVKGAMFHDGRPITSEDVAFSVMTVKKYHPFKSMFAPVERVDTPDPQTAVIRLTRPHPAILLAMSPSLLPILPKHIYGDGQDLKTHPANLAPVGSGPFRLVKYEHGKQILLRRNPDFFIPGRPYLDQIVIRLEPDPKAQMIGIKRQEAHLVPLFLDLEALEKLAKSEHLIVTSKGYEGIGAINWLAFNLLRKPLDDKRVRQAIAYAIDIDFIIRYLHRGRSRRAPSPISPDSPFYDATVPMYRGDLEKARTLLDQSGYPIDRDGKRFSLTLDYIPVVPSQQKNVALYIKRQLSKVGIHVAVRRSKSFPAWAQRIGNWDFDMTMDLVYNWGDPVIGVDRTYLSRNIRKGIVWSNTQNYRNNRVDRLLDEAAREMDPVRRKKLYREFQRILTDDLPIVWINTVPFHTIYHRLLGNPPVSVWGVHSPLDELYWKQPIDRGYLPTPGLETNPPLLKRVGVRAISILKKQGLYQALDIFQDKDQEFLDLQGSGLHLIGVTSDGIVFLDNSGQMSPGMNISGIRDLEGKRLVRRFWDAAASRDKALFRSKGVWPHPGTHRVGPMSTWCGMLTDTDVICALKWDPEK